MADELNIRYPKLQLELRDRLNAYWKTSSELISMSVEAFGSNMGMVALLFKATLQWQPPNKELPRSLVIKLPRIGTRSQLVETIEKETGNASFASEFLDVSHDVEVQLYDMFQRLEQPPMPIARCYMMEKMNVTTKRGIIVLEDLSQKAVQLDDISTSLTVGQLFSVASAVADLHSWCLTTTTDWKSDLANTEQKLKKFENIQSMVSSGFKWLKANYADRMVHKDFSLALKHFNESPQDRFFKRWGHILPTILTQGDLWTNNIFFKPNQDGSCSDELAAIIDWQMAHCGNMFEDLAIVVTWCVSAEIRRTHSRDLINHYRQRLIENVEDKVELPSMDVFWSAFNEVWPTRALLLSGMIEMILGTIVKLDKPHAAQRKEIMINRALACYDDAMAMLEER
uniref:CHK domain-containing protein n=1 Tax=Trichuris muris TaxID=70415 RepID=A0A5S6R0K3_TRIMR